MTTIKNLLNMLPDSYTRKFKEKWAHYLALLAEYNKGNTNSGYDILKLFQQCGPLIAINTQEQSWGEDCVVTITYNHATQIQDAEIPSNKLRYYGEWFAGRLPDEFDDEDFAYGFETGMYMLVTINDVEYEADGSTPLDPADVIPVNKYMYYNGSNWIAIDLSWRKENIYGKEVKIPVYTPVTSGGQIEEKTVTFTIKAGTIENTQRLITTDYAYKVTSITATGADDQDIKIFCLADNGVRILYAHCLDKEEQLLQYIMRRYFTNMEPCPNEDCDYNCPVCGGYGYIDNTESGTPYDAVSYDYLTKLLGDAKGVKFQKNWERYRWRIWSKYWLVEPTDEKIREFIGHFTGIDPDRITITTQNYPELIWTIRVPVKSGKNILGTDDSDYASIIDDIGLAGGTIIIKDILTYYDGIYDYYSSELVPVKVQSYDGVNYIVTSTEVDYPYTYEWIDTGINGMTASYTGTDPYYITTTTNITNTYLEEGQRVLTRVYDSTPTLLVTEYARVGTTSSNAVILYYDHDLGLTTENTVDIVIPFNMIISGNGTPNYEGVAVDAFFHDKNKIQFYTDVSLSANDIIFLDSGVQKNVMDKVFKGRRMVDYAGDHIGKRNSFDFNPIETYKICNIDALEDNLGNDKVTIYDYGYFLISSHGDSDTLTQLGCVKIGNNEYDIQAVEFGDFDTNGDEVDVKFTLTGFDFNTANVGDEIKIYLNGYNTDTDSSVDIADFDDFVEKLIYNECYYRV